MKLSFDDKESFMEASGSLHFDNHPSDPNTTNYSILSHPTHQRMGSSSSSMPTQERSEDKEDLGEE
jgi:hypothetical protein